MRMTTARLWEHLKQLEECEAGGKSKPQVYRELLNEIIALRTVGPIPKEEDREPIS